MWKLFSDFHDVPVNLIINITIPSYVSLKKIRLPANQQRKDESRLFLLINPSFRFVSCRPRDQRPNISLHSPPLTGEQAHTQPHMLKKTTKHCYHGPHNLPAPSDSNVTGECDRRTSRDRSRSSRSVDVIFIDETKKTFILFTTILCASAQHARRQKVSFWSDGSCFFRCRFIETTRTDPSYSPISFLQRPPSTCCVLARFWTRGVWNHRRHGIVR